MNTEKFTGKAQAYAKARPGYPDEAMEYIHKLASPDAVFADIGAGTGKFTALLARYGHEIFAIEPNADMREQLAITLAPFPDIKIVNGTAEATTLSVHSVDVITCAQALNWFNIDAFRAECRRIGKLNVIVISLHNYMLGDSDSISRYKQSTSAFFRNPAVQEFPNPVFYTRDKWLQYISSIHGSLQQSDTGYEPQIAEMNGIFDRDNTDGLLRLNLVTKVYSERMV